MEVLEPPDRAVLREAPIAVGVVLPKGALRASQTGRVVDNRGRSAPLDVEVTAWWEPEYVAKLLSRMLRDENAPGAEMLVGCKELEPLQKWYEEHGTEYLARWKK